MDDMMERKIWLIYSREHNAFWRPNSTGYTWDISAAGRYTKAEAGARCNIRDQDPDGGPSEVTVIAPEAEIATPVDLATLAEGMGLAVVPVEPTYEIGKAAYHAFDSFDEDGGPVIFGPEEAMALYRAMLAAGRIKPGQEEDTLMKQVPQPR